MALLLGQLSLVKDTASAVSFLRQAADLADEVSFPLFNSRVRNIFSPLTLSSSPFLFV